MKMILSTLMAVALVGPSLALAGEPDADARKAGEAAEVAGAKAERAGAAAEKAGDKAEHAAERAKQADHPRYATPDKGDLAHAKLALAALEKADPGLTRFFDGSAGYAVFATVGKGAVGVGGAHGTGVVFEHGRAVGEVSLNQLTVGLALGGQSYTEIVFFETARSLADFKKSKFTMAAQVSAVVAAAGASKNAKYVEGVSVFTLAKGGVMVEASVGGQRFNYLPFETSVALGSL
jgi:hypothetical protein